MAGYMTFLAQFLTKHCGGIGLKSVPCFHKTPDSVSSPAERCC